MRADLLVPRIGADLLHLLKVEDSALGPADGGLDGERADRGRIGWAGCLFDGLGHLVQTDGRLPSPERDQVQSAQELGAIALVSIEMAFFLDEDAAMFPRERAHRKVVGQGSGRQEQRTLFPKQSGKELFQFLDRAAV
jgi:hypothetical protein